MSLYSEKDFKYFLLSEMKWSEEQTEKIIKFTKSFITFKTKSWKEFSEKFAEELSFILPDDFIMPEKDNIQTARYSDYENAVTLDEIKACLDRIRNDSTKIHLEAYILNSQSMPDNENYFALLWKNTFNPKTKRYYTFLCLYCQVLLTQKISSKMLSWIIITYGQKVSGKDRDWIPDTINANFSKDYNFDNAERSTKLAIAYILRKPSYKEKGIDKLRRLRTEFTDIFGCESYDTRSFYEMIILYITYNNLPFCTVGDMISKMAFKIIRKLLPDSVSDEKILDYVANNTKLQLLDLTNYTTSKGVLCSCDSSLKWNNPNAPASGLRKIVEKRLEKLKVPGYFRDNNNLNRAKNTYIFLTTDIFTLMTSSIEGFIDNITANPDMYVYYSYNYKKHNYASMLKGKGMYDLVKSEEKADDAETLYYNDELEKYKLKTQLDEIKQIINAIKAIEKNEKGKRLNDEFKNKLQEFKMSVPVSTDEQPITYSDWIEKYDLIEKLKALSASNEIKQIIEAINRIKELESNDSLTLPWKKKIEKLKNMLLYGYDNILKQLSSITVTIQTGAWKKKLHALSSIEEKREFLRKKFSVFFDNIDRNYESNSPFRKYQNYSKFHEEEREELFDKIIALSLADEQWRLTRASYMKNNIFDNLEKGSDGTDFIEAFSSADELDDYDLADEDILDFEGEDFLERIGWDPFDPLNYQDIFLYMCCNTPDRMETFRQLEADGYLYDDTQVRK